MDGSTRAQPVSVYRWPDDYIALDNGRVLVRPDCVDGFRESGWETLAGLMQATNVEVIRSLTSRDNCKVQIPTANGSVVGYLKRHRVRSLRRWYLESGRRRAAQSPGMAEAGAVGWCQAAGVPTVNVIAAGHAKGNRSWQSDSFFISEELANCQPANNHWFQFEQRHSPPDGFASSLQTRHEVLQAVARTARRFHRAGLSHYDFYLEHFFVTPGPNPTAFLLDLQRVEHHPHAPTRWRAVNKDLGQFLSSCDRYGFSADERSEWSRWYFADESGPRGLTMGDSLRVHVANGRLQLRRFRRKLQKRPNRAA